MQGSFHGTSINIIQHPTIENLPEIRIQFSINPSLKEAHLPEHYSIIPAATNKKTNIKISNMNNEIDLATLVKITLKYIASAIEKEDEWFSNAEDEWLSNAQNLLISTLDDLTCISWTAYHSPVQQASVNPASIVDISF